jgi:4-amino-4-deoxy-L-arabinose transferase-like glycosyltransferase
MTSVEPFTQSPAATPTQPAGIAAARRRGRSLAVRPELHHLALVGVLAFSAVLNTHRLSQNGYANIYYSAGVRSMLRSWQNFFFVSYDPGGLVTVDKPPLGLWVEAASAKVFGFSPLSLLLPEAIMGVLAVAVLYYLVSRRFGPLAGIAGALALAVFPSFVAVSRDTGVDTLLILLMLLACGAGIRAAESGRWRTLVWSAVLVGLAFNTKTLAALLVVPGIALAYLLCAPGTLPRRTGQLLVAGVVMFAVSFSWMAVVEATPASKRPYVGSSTNNTELGLTFEYNGLGRVQGQVGGPGQIPSGRGALAHYRFATSTFDKGDKPRPRRSSAAGGSLRRAAKPARQSGSGPRRAKNPVAFPGPTGPLRLLGVGLGEQGGWIIPFALFGLVGLALLSGRGRDGTAATVEPSGGGLRADPRLPAIIVLGGWFLVEAAVLSLSKGIVHPYYVAALAPGAAAMAGAGAVALGRLAGGPRRDWRMLVIPCAVAATVAAQVVLMNRERYLQWFIPVLLAGAALGLAALLSSRRLARAAMALTFCLLLVAPAAFATTTWLAPVEGTFPAAGPTQAAGPGGVGFAPNHLRVIQALLDYAITHRPGKRWVMLTDASNTAAPMILLGYDAGALAGYSGTDPVLDGPGLARLVSRGEARYVVLGGQFSHRGGNRATAAVLRACRQVTPSAWDDPAVSAFGLVPYDCAGRERALSSA